MNKRVHIAGKPTADQALQTVLEVFELPGVYHVELLAKASAPGGFEEPFEQWFLEALWKRCQAEFGGAQEAIWDVLDGLLKKAGVRIPSDLEWFDLNSVLFDLTTASTARMVGLQIPNDLAARLQLMGFTMPEVLDFPALAYRMGRIYDRLAQGDVLEWSELRRLARSQPLSISEQLAVAQARQRAGIWMRPIFDATGQVWTAERELPAVRDIASRAIESRIGARAAARELSATQRGQGIIRDAERVMRTEMAEARARGAWDARKESWDADTLIYRIVSADPCKACLRLYVLPSGMPRLWRMKDVEQSSREPNRGPQDSWTPKIGPTHPQCLCAPWQRWYAETAEVHEMNAEKMRDLMEQRGLREAA